MGWSKSSILTNSNLSAYNEHGFLEMGNAVFTFDLMGILIYYISHKIAKCLLFPGISQILVLHFLQHDPFPLNGGCYFFTLVSVLRLPGHFHF